MLDETRLEALAFTSCVPSAQRAATSSLDQVSAALPAVASAWEEQGRSWVY